MLKFAGVPQTALRGGTRNQVLRARRVARAEFSKRTSGSSPIRRCHNARIVHRLAGVPRIGIGRPRCVIVDDENRRAARRGGSVIAIDPSTLEILPDRIARQNRARTPAIVGTVVKIEEPAIAVGASYPW